ncbi:hypothetical protein LUZ60_011392 [Juncus effusus]|nr:hypothetical protein LUZ60_011392 [Juncus effusus]
MGIRLICCAQGDTRLEREPDISSGRNKERVKEMEGCETPKRLESRIPAMLPCPAPPKKKLVPAKNKNPPKNGYFEPPDLESLFKALHGREACA